MRKLYKYCLVNSARSAGWHGVRKYNVVGGIIFMKRDCNLHERFSFIRSNNFSELPPESFRSSTPRTIDYYVFHVKIGTNEFRILGTLCIREEVANRTGT